MAHEALFMAVRSRPEDPHAWVALGRALLESGDRERAWMCYERAFHLDPHLVEAQRVLSFLSPPYLNPN